MWGQAPCPSVLGSSDSTASKNQKDIRCLRQSSRGGKHSYPPLQSLSLTIAPRLHPGPVSSISLRAAALLGPLFPTYPVAPDPAHLSLMSHGTAKIRSLGLGEARKIKMRIQDWWTGSDSPEWHVAEPNPSLF